MPNHIFDLPSGARCVRVDDETRRYVFSAAGASLTVADVEALYADTLADGQQMVDCRRSRRFATMEAAGKSRLARGLRNPEVRGCGECGGYHLVGDRT